MYTVIYDIYIYILYYVYTHNNDNNDNNNNKCNVDIHVMCVLWNIFDQCSNYMPTVCKPRN